MSEFSTPSDAVFQAMRRRLEGAYHIALSDFDRGVAEVSVLNHVAVVREGVGAGDGEASPPEIAQEAIRMAERSGGFLRFLQDGRKLDVPWAAGLLDGSSAGASLKSWFQKSQSARSLFLRMIRQGASGLGLRYQFSESEPLHSWEDVVRSRRANCLEFVSLYLMGAQRNGIEAVPVQIFEDSKGVSLNHVAVGIVNPKTHRIESIADIALSYFGPPLPGWVWSPISKIDLLAYHYNSMAESAGDLVAQEKLIDFALRLSPRNYLVLISKAYYRYRAGDLEGARSSLRDSLASYPDHPDAQRKLRVVEAELQRKTNH